MKVKVSNVNAPNWREITVKSYLPKGLEKLSEMARNIWWSWNYEATKLFKDLNPELWEKAGQNPVLLLELMDYESLQELAKDENLLKRVDKVYAEFRAYMDVEPDKNVLQLLISVWSMD